MLAIRLQRIGRKGYPVYRLAVQESQRHPSSGRVVAYVGSYNPHTKEANVQVEAAQKYLDNGAQPTPRVVKLLKDAGVTLPKWVKEAATDKQKSIRMLKSYARISQRKKLQLKIQLPKKLQPKLNFIKTQLTTPDWGGFVMLQLLYEEKHKWLHYC